MIGNFDEFDHHRDPRDVRLAGDEIEELDHRAFRIDEPLVHVDVDDLRAVGHLIARDRERAGEVACGDQLAELRRAGDVRPLADVDEGDVGGEGERLEAGKPHQRRNGRDGARLDVADRLGDRADVLGSRAAAAADDVDETVAGELGDLGRHHLGALVVLAEGVREAGVRIGADERVRGVGDFLQMLAHRACAERAVEADGEGARMAHRVPEGGRRLAGKGAPGTVGDRSRNHQRHADAAFGEDFLAGEDGRLGVQRVEDRFDQDEVGAAVDQAADLLAVGDAQFIERDRAVARIADVGRQRRRAIGGPERAGHEATAPVGLFGFGRSPSSQPRAVTVEVIDDALHAVVGLRDRSRGKGVRFENVRSRHRIGEVDVFDGFRLGQREKVVVPLLMAFAGRKAVPAKMRLGKAERLNLGAHRAVKYQDTPVRRAAQGVDGGQLMRESDAENGVEGIIHL